MRMAVDVVSLPATLRRAQKLELGALVKRGLIMEHSHQRDALLDGIFGLYPVPEKDLDGIVFRFRVPVLLPLVKAVPNRLASKSVFHFSRQRSS